MKNGRNKEVIFMWNGRMEFRLLAINGAKCALTLHTCIFVMYIFILFQMISIRHACNGAFCMP